MDENIKKLSEKEYWDGVHKDKSVTTRSFFKLRGIKNIVMWFNNREFYRICKKHFKKEYKNIFEVGCAPGNYLIKFNELFWLQANGIEYSQDWVNILNKNFKKNNIQWNIIHWDFFDKKFLEENEEKYDIVYSIWFIEHFDNTQEVIDNHFKIAKKWGTIIIVIPNLCYVNKCLTTNKVLNICNLDIIHLDQIKIYLKKYKTLEIRYFWWLFNIWLFSYTNKFLEKIRFMFFIVQRLFFDPICILLSILWVNLNNKYASPSIIAICKKT